MKEVLMKSMAAVMVCLMLAAILSPALLMAEEAVSPAPAATATAPATPAPAPKIDTGDTAWMIVATAWSC